MCSVFARDPSSHRKPSKPLMPNVSAIDVTLVWLVDKANEHLCSNAFVSERKDLYSQSLRPSSWVHKRSTAPKIGSAEYCLVSILVDDFLGPGAYMK